METESVLEAIFAEEGLEEGEYVEDIEMIDAETLQKEEGDDDKEILDVGSMNAGTEDDDSVKAIMQEARSTARKQKERKRRKNKSRKRNGSATSVSDINRFVIDACRRLKEKKSYLVWNAVGCLGVSTMSELIKEVEVIQGCGGQLTADGKRFRTGGGVLWNILKRREPNAFKEIMARGREFEKQFRQRNIQHAPMGNQRAASENSTNESCRQASKDSKAAADNITNESYRQAPKENKAGSENSTIESNRQEPKGSKEETYKIGNEPDNTGIVRVSDNSQLKQEVQPQRTQSNGSQRELVSVFNRIRIPVSYDDLFAEDVKDETIAS